MPWSPSSVSDKLGNIDYANQQENYLGGYQGGTSHASDTQKVIDEEVMSLVDEGYETAKNILTEKADDLEALAQGLLEYETLTGDEITKVINGEPLNRGSDDDPTPEPPSGGASVTAIPTAGRKPGPETDMEPEPTT